MSIKEVQSYEKLKPSIIAVGELLHNDNVIIPEYQRPYKWSPKNVNALIDDILHFQNSDSYRLGTVVYYENKEQNTFELVDGQQRSITLSLILLAISKNEVLMNELNDYRVLIPNNSAIENFNFTNSISKENIRTNYNLIQRRIVDFNYKTVNFMLNKCEFVKVVIDDISEAFQFFDSQNARGRDLNPHDLLKAFHLREIGIETNETEVNKIVDSWEEIDSAQLSRSFAEYLFRIRHWSKGKSARFFTKNDIGEFKGISPTIKEPYPYADMYRITHFYLEGFNKDYQRKIDQNEISFPFQLDQVLINGKRFFEMVHHYNQKISAIDDFKTDLKLKKESVAGKILDTLDEYVAKNRTGDKYVRSLFNAALLYYIDKFGNTELERAIEKIFIWAYTLRLKRQSVQLASMDNYALEAPFIFKEIKDALQPSDFLNIHLKVINESEYQNSNSSGKLNDIVDLFKELKAVQ